MIGSVSFAGSMMAFAKLQELLTGRPITYPGQRFVHAVAVIVIVGVGAWTIVAPHLSGFVILALVALALGAGICLPVGGADTPVLISLLNTLTGLAVAADGFALNNLILVVAGTLVGTSGALLTKMMSDAMGRSLPNIILGGLPSAGSTEVVGGGRRPGGALGRRHRHRDAARLLAPGAHRPRLRPGRGPGPAHRGGAGQGPGSPGGRGGLRHPSGGRADARSHERPAGRGGRAVREPRRSRRRQRQVPSADVALVVGANDVVNPAARDDPSSPLYGMPILNADQATHVVFLKRSMRPGFSGVDNALLYDPRTVPALRRRQGLVDQAGERGAGGLSGASRHRPAQLRPIVSRRAHA